MTRVLVNWNTEKKLNLVAETCQEISSITQEITIILWLHLTNQINSNNTNNTTTSSNGINYHLLPTSSSSSSGNICIFDISALGSASTDNPDTLWFLLNLISLSSAILVEKSSDDNSTLNHFQFLEHSLLLFHNEMGSLKSAIPFPPLILYSSSPLATKESKKLIENFLKPESGFSEDISRRNAIRGLVDSLFHSREFLTPDSPITDQLQLLSSINFVKRFSLFHSLPFGCLVSNGLLISKILHSLIEDGVGYQRLSQEVRDQLIEEYLTHFEELSYYLFSSKFNTQQKMNDSNTLHILKTLKRDAMRFHSNHIAIWNQTSVESKKKLQAQIDVDVTTFRNTLYQQITENCQQYLVDYDNSTPSLSSSTTSESSGLSNSTLTLGESTNSYNEFLALKNAIEKLVTSYSTATQSYVTIPPSDQTSAGTNTSIGNDDRIFPDEIQSLRSEILRSYLIQRLKKSLEMGGNWLVAFNDLVNATSIKKDSMKSHLQSLQSRNIELDRSIDQKKRVTAENYRLLTASLTELRSKQTLELEAKHSELESLVEAIDRSTRLNEREKAEVADELMEIQQRIQVAQAKALELRQQREEQTNLLHNNLLESEREGHRWFRTAFANQHTLLAEELSLERQLNQRKSEQLAELFALEGEHLRHLDNLRTLGQKETQKVREEHFNKRDALSKEHEATMTYLRMRNIELEGKLTSNQNPSTNKSEEGCQVM